MNKEEALAICFTNLKGYKDKDLFGTAEALQYLKSLPEYGSNDKVGKAVGVSGEVVREFLTIFRLPTSIQGLFKNRQLKHLEQVRRLWQLGRKRSELLEDTAKAISDLSAWDGRHVVEAILRNPGMSIIEAKKAVIDMKTTREHEFHVVAILPEKAYKLLAGEATKQQVSVDTLVTKITLQWLEERGLK